MKNSAESLIYMSEKAVKDAGDKIKPEDKKLIEDKIEELKKIKDGSDVETVKKVSRELSTEIQKIGQAMYQSPQGQQTEEVKPAAEDDPRPEGREEKKEEEKK